MKRLEPLGLEDPWNCAGMGESIELRGDSSMPELELEEVELDRDRERPRSGSP